MQDEYVVWAGTENSLFFCSLRRNHYEKFAVDVFALVLFFTVASTVQWASAETGMS